MKHLILVVMINMIASAASVENIDLLKGHRWTHRVLLVFANDDIDPRATQLEATLEAADCELADRHMVVVWILTDATSRVGGTVISEETANLLRSELRTQPGEFAVLLIGKDGGVKARYDVVPELEEIFGLIDGMPMRRAELRSQPFDCSG